MCSVQRICLKSDDRYSYQRGTEHGRLMRMWRDSAGNRINLAREHHLWRDVDDKTMSFTKVKYFKSIINILLLSEGER